MRIIKQAIGTLTSWAAAMLWVGFAFAGSADLYFPPANGKWETVSLKENRWDAGQLKIALDYAGEQNSSGVVILHRGRILAEQYWEPDSREDGNPAKRPAVKPLTWRRHSRRS